MSQLASTMTDLETLWEIIDHFFERFSVQDWSRKHGREWTFADMPYHLAYFNQMVIDGIANDHNQHAKSTLQELNTWNDAQFGKRPANLSGARGLDHLHATQLTLKEFVARNRPDTPILLPLIIVGGWRTLEFAVEYLLDHTWLHFTESHLRFYNRLPDMPAPLMQRNLNFAMQMAGGALTPEYLDGVHLVTTLKLTGEAGGVWTFTIDAGRCEVVAQEVANPDTIITTDIATYLKTSLYSMQNPLSAVLTGKTRIKGFNKAQQFQKLFTQSTSRAWRLVEQGKATPVPE